ncbi:protein-L-isoaspartate O-methyltransferase family protein [Tessaracoccus caeni]|uniref:protein-L-isoaspartate O-methyltransferase family protein n=1 Tax=Tessaracoccus caeni TaxID=3031239 RepID=UPI0023DA70D3|nr:protein-L-isoaspartate O-methyltransferase [Tessaracoccus caeni]MDF1489814.1 protein-L-isoaspartate O-methyltransferase [Tessaracoccus caeni]
MTEPIQDDLLEARLDAAFEATPRADYLPEKVRDRAGQDRPLPIPRNQTNSQPSTVRDMLWLLEVPEGAKVLDVGAGSGWTTALLAHLTGPEGSVLGVELEPELVEFGTGNLAKAERPWAEIRQATKGRVGAPADGPFDRILVSAQARKLPEELVKQLAPGGILVIPVASQMWRVTLDENRKRSIDRLGAYLFVPLR